MDESGPSNPHKGSSPDAGLEKPISDAVPTVVPASSKGKEANDSEVVIKKTRQGAPPAKNVLAKVIDDKRQVMNRPFRCISEKTSIDEVYNQSLVYTTEHHNIVTHLRRRYEVFSRLPTLVCLNCLMLLICIYNPLSHYV